MSESDDPEWLPDEYDRDADLADRLPIMAEIDGGIEVWGGDERGHSEILGEPHRVEENGRGTLILYAGGSEFNWSYCTSRPVTTNRVSSRSTRTKT